MGRTGRKRDGHVLVLLTQGKEEDNYKKAWDDYRFIQNEIESGNKFTYHHDQSPRILPRAIVPAVDKQYIEIPFENTQPEPKKRARATKGKKDKIIKPFFMPDGARTGFMKASKIGKDDDSAEDSDGGEDFYAEELAPVLQDPQAGLLTGSEEKELNRKFKTVYDTEGEMQVVALPALDAFPDFQRNLTKTKYVKHGRASKNMVRMLRKMNNMDDETIDKFREKFDPELLKPPPAPVIQRFQPKTKAFKPVVPAKGLFERSGNAPKPKAISKVKRKRNGSSGSIDELATTIDLMGSSDESDIKDNEDKEMGSGSNSPPPAGSRRPFDTGSSDDELPDIADMIKGFQAKPKPKPNPMAIKPMKSKTAKAAAGRKAAAAMKGKVAKRVKRTKRVEDSDGGE